MNIYLSNKMTGIPYFNAPWFDKVTAELRALPATGEVFNPADHDRENGFEPMSCPTGTLEEAFRNGFKQIDALVSDWVWIGRIADCVVVGPDWHDSKGAISEMACAQAIGKPVYEYGPFLAAWDKPHLIQFKLPPIMELGGKPDWFADWRFNGT
jgi:hypothetical protein